MRFGASAMQAAAERHAPRDNFQLNGLHALQKGMDLLKSGGDTLDATIAAVTVVEDDPNDNSVGFGGFPTKKASPNSILA